MRTATATALCLPLDAVDLADVDHVGGKAATLGELRRAGFPVPPGVVLTAAVLDTALAAASGGTAEPAATGPATGSATGSVAPAAVGADDIRRLPLPDEVIRALADALVSLAGEDGGPVAVRSSGIAEDLAGQSFAGQYTSRLDVTGARDVADAVRECWSSAYDQRVHAYVAAGAPEAVGRMAVLIQPMVPALAAGVAFTANPVTGDRDETVVEAVVGLGDGLAAGAVTPEAWTVRGGVARRSSAGHGVLSAATAAEVAALARRVAAWLGDPQDIEWAVTGKGVVLLQARPITALPPAPAGPPATLPAGGTTPEGFWLRGGYSLRPLSPMNVPTMLRAVDRTSPELFRYALGERIRVCDVGGWSYVQFAQPREAGEIRAKLVAIAGALRAGEPRRVVTRWRAVWEPAAVASIARMRVTDPATLPDRALALHVVRRLAFAERMQRLHFRVGGATTVEWAALGLRCEQELGWDVPQVLDLLVGLPGKTTEPSFALSGLVADARGRPGLAGRLTADPPPSLDDLARFDPAYAAKVRTYLGEYGQRCLGADVAEPTMQERPEVTIRLLADALRDDRDPAAEIVASAAAHVEAADRARRGFGDAAEFDRLLARAQDAYPLRDDTAFYGHVAWGQFRYGVLALGARLVDRGLLDARDDVFLLTLDEATAALTGGGRLRELAERRRAEVAYAADHRGPLTIGVPPGQPVQLDAALDEVGDAERADLAVVRWADAAYRIGTARSEQGGAVLHGVAACAGTYVGPARILVTEADFGKLRPGDVMVCPETTPQWSVLFGSVGALVTDTGGLLSHPAIIAREYRVPAVVATGNATRLLHDGQLVAVDGGTGVVEVLAERGAA